jgi:hypothetical protein
MICCTNKPSNRNKGLYNPLPIPTQAWEIISMDFVGDLPTTQKGHDNLYLVVDRFSKMYILISCKKTTKGQEETNLSFEHVWLHLGISRRSSHIGMSNF